MRTCLILLMTKLAVNLAIDVVFLKDRSNIKTANNFELFPHKTEHILKSFTLIPELQERPQVDSSSQAPR